MIKPINLNDFTVQSVDNYYVNILSLFFDNQIPYQVLTEKKTRAVWLIEIENKKYTIKWDCEKINHLDQKIKLKFQGAFYPNLMKRIEKAKQMGCKLVGSIYVVAQRKKGNILETYLLSEYVEGVPIKNFGEDYSPYQTKIKEAVKQLHQFRLASCDLNPFNILLTDNNEIKIIDLSDNGMFCIAKAKDARHLKRFYNINLNNRPGILYHLVGLRDKWIKLSRKLRNKK